MLLISYGVIHEVVKIEMKRRMKEEGVSILMNLL